VLLDSSKVEDFYLELRGVYEYNKKINDYPIDI
jgi:hypothetical protein